jgi:hypothetical protein
MVSYLTLDGEVINLDGLTPEERSFLERCRSAYEAGMDWLDFSLLAQGNENPVVRAQGQVTDSVAGHPLYRAVWDLEMRLGIRQGEVAADAAEERAPEPFLEEAVAGSGPTTHTR